MNGPPPVYLLLFVLTEINHRPCRVLYAWNEVRSTMLAINIPEYTSPANYQLSELPKPVVEDPKDVLIKVHAASVNPVDVKKAGGALKSVMKER
jgi:hypothetical protein